MTSLCAAALALVVAASGPGGGDPIDAIATGDRPAVERAIDRIQYLGTPRATVKKLVQMVEGNTPGSPQSALYALSVLHPVEAAGAFSDQLGSDDGQMRLLSCQGLARLPVQKKAARAVAARLGDAVPAVRRACARTLAAWKGAKQGPALARALAHEQDAEARLAEIDALGHAPGSTSVKALEGRLEGGGETEKLAAAHGLALLGAPSGKKVLLGYATSSYPDVRGTAVQLLADVPAHWASDALAQLANDEVAATALRAGKALVDRKDPRGIPALVLRAERAKGPDRDGFESALAELKVTQAQRLDIIAKAGGAK